jgi:hypothetical protein
MIAPASRALARPLPSNVFAMSHRGEVVSNAT